MFNKTNFLIQCFRGILISVLFYFYSLMIFQQNFLIDRFGRSSDYSSLSIFMFTNLMNSVQLGICLNVQYWSQIMLLVFTAFSYGCYLLYLFVSSFVGGSLAYASVFLFQNLNFYIGIIFISGTLFIFDLFFFVVYREINIDL